MGNALRRSPNSRQPIDLKPHAAIPPAIEPKKSSGIKTSDINPQKIDCILVTHGDADHFAGLPEIFKSETNKVMRKRLFIEPGFSRAAFGIVKTRTDGKSLFVCTDRATYR